MIVFVEMVEGFSVKQPPKRERMTNLTGEGVVHVKTCNSADTGPCGHGRHEEEKESCIRGGKGEEGRQAVYRAYM